MHDIEVISILERNGWIFDVAYIKQFERYHRVVLCKSGMTWFVVDIFSNRPTSGSRLSRNFDDVLEFLDSYKGDWHHYILEASHA
jgi:hypothetical protein